MDTLPVCSVRKISYSTFTIVDIDTAGYTRIIEHGNPSFVVLRPGGEVDDHAHRAPLAEVAGPGVDTLGIPRRAQ